jgi:translation initiation factor IF-3
MRQSRPAERPVPREFRLIGADGVNLGIVTREAANELAEEEGLDLVAVAPDATPAVYRIANASKLKYEAEIKAREARRGSQKASVKELKYRPNIDEHDFVTKSNWVRKFIAQGHIVKITVMLRGREQDRPEIAEKIFTRLENDLIDVAQIRGEISRYGRDIIGTFEPKQVK